MESEFNEDSERNVVGIEDTGSTDQHVPPYISLVFYSSRHITTINRSYMGLSLVLSKIGATVSILTMVIRVIYGVYNQFSLRLKTVTNSTLQHYIKRTQEKFSVFDVLLFNLCFILSSLKMG